MTEEYQRQTDAAEETAAAEPEVNPVRRLTEGALMVALSVILGLVSLYLPLLNMVAMIIWPLPVCYLIKKYGLPFGLLAFLASGVLLALFMGIVNAAYMILAMGAVGIWYGVAFRRNFRPMRTLFGGVVLAGLSMLAVAVMSLWLSGTTVSSLTAYFSDYLTEVMQLMNQGGMLDTMLAGVMTADEYIRQTLDLMQKLLPALLMISAMVEAWLCYVITAAVFRRLHFAVTPLPKFRDWHLPWLALWGLIVALAAYVGYYFLEITWMQTIAYNILYIYGLLLTVVGLSFIIWVYKKQGSKLIIGLLVVMILLFYNSVIWMLILLGLADCVMDFRSRAREQEKAAAAVPPPHRPSYFEGESAYDSDSAASRLGDDAPPESEASVTAGGAGKPKGESAAPPESADTRKHE